MKKTLAIALISAAALVGLQFPAHAGWENGLSSNGLSTNGLSTNGLSSNGLSSNGLSSNGLSSNGVTSTGAPLNPAGSADARAIIIELPARPSDAR